MTSFDPNSYDLSAMAETHKSQYIYKDRKGNLWVDTNDGLFAPFVRFVATLVGARDYKLKNILQIISNTTATSDKNMAYLRGKVAKGCGIDPEKYEKVRLAAHFIEGDAQKKAEVDEFIDTVATDKSLQSKIQAYDKKIKKIDPKQTEASTVLKRAATTAKWLDLGLSKDLIHNDFAGAEFLLNTRVIYNIVGYQNTTAAGKEIHKLTTNADNKIMILKEGVPVCAADLAKDYEFDKEWQEVRSKTNPEERWNYFSPQGLVPVDRWTHKEFVPVEKLSTAEMNTLRDHAQTFFPHQPADPLKDCVVQIFTNPRKVVKGGNNPLLTRFEASAPVHAAIRVITSDGTVYSTGFGSTVDEDKQVEGKMLATINGMPTILDYEEFRKHEGRVVTSIPITTDACNAILDKLQKYRDETIRFNLLAQNCTTLAVDVLDTTGVKVNNQVNAMEYINSSLPSVYTVPLVGTAARKIKKGATKVNESLPTVAQKAIQKGNAAIKYVPEKFAAIFANILTTTQGATVGTKQPENAIKETEGMEKFQSMVENPLDLLSRDTTKLSHSLVLIQWQLQQKSTVVHPYENQPAMGILPPAPSDEQKTIHNRLIKKYLHNFGKEVPK